MKHLGLALMMGLLAASCGDDGGEKGNGDTDGDETPDETGGDGDATGGDGDEPNGPGDVDTGTGLVINAALGLEVIDHPPEDDSNLRGLVLLAREGDGPVSPSVTLNGIGLTEDPILRGFGAPKGFQFDDIGPGKSLMISAMDAKGDSNLELPCPSDVQITAPKDGDMLRVGDKVTVSWSGDVHEHNQEIMTPSVQFHQPNEFNGKWGLILNGSANIEKGKTSIEVTVPKVTGEQVIALQLHVPGPFITTNNSANGKNSGVCWLVRRIALNVAP